MSKKNKIIIIASAVIAVELIILAVFMIRQHRGNNPAEETTTVTEQDTDTILYTEIPEETTFETVSESLFFETITETTVEKKTTEEETGRVVTETKTTTTTVPTTKEKTTWDRNKYKNTTERTTAVWTTKPKPTTTDESSYRAKLDNCDAEILEYVNAERKKHGLNPVKSSRVVAKAAQIRAKELSVVFGHTRPITGNSFYTAITNQGYRSPNRAENLAAGPDTAWDVYYAWINCEEHRVNILNPTYKYVGTACYYNRATKYQTYWDQLFTDELYKIEE